jgi:hypothetical protein
MNRLYLSSKNWITDIAFAKIYEILFDFDPFLFHDLL